MHGYPLDTYDRIFVVSLCPVCPVLCPEIMRRCATFLRRLHAPTLIFTLVEINTYCAVIKVRTRFHAFVTLVTIVAAQKGITVHYDSKLKNAAACGPLISLRGLPFLTTTVPKWATGDASKID